MRRGKGRNRPNLSQSRKENNYDETNETEGNEKIKVLLVGHSELRRVDASKLSNNQRDVEVKFTRGMKIKQAVQKTGKCEKDVIIVHVGTNNLSMGNPDKICKETMEMLSHTEEQLRVQNCILVNSYINEKTTLF